MIKEMFNGLFMALADSVPGVSGGTIAFIMGFYDKFIGSINDIVYEKGEKRKAGIIYISKLLCGWAIGMIGAVLILSSTFEKHIYGISSLFVGFIIASIPVIVRDEKESIKGKYQNIIFMILGIVFVYFIAKMNTAGGSGTFDLSSISFTSAVYLFVAGMIAISAMFLPGISGSTILLIFGLYMAIISSIKEVLHFNLQYVPSLFIFGMGVIAGALSVVKIIKICLEKFRSQTVYAILGMMIGSLYAIFMGPATLKVPQAPMTMSTFNFITCLIGTFVIFTIQNLNNKIEKGGN